MSSETSQITYDWSLKPLAEPALFATFDSHKVFVTCNHAQYRVMFTDSLKSKEAYEMGMSLKTRYNFIDFHFMIPFKYKEANRIIEGEYGEWSRFDIPDVWVRDPDTSQPGVIKIRSKMSEYSKIENAASLLGVNTDQIKLIIKTISEREQYYKLKYGR